VRKWLVILTIVVLALAPASTVLADSSADITVTATGIVGGNPGIPTGFTVFYISDYEVGISWTKGESANNTMIRAKYGSYPTSRTDGYLVYYGEGTSTSDTGVSLDETATNVYYRAWSEDSGGVWSNYAEGNIGGFGMLTIGIALIVLVLTTMAFVLKNALLHMVCIVGWLLFGFYMWNVNWPEDNTYLPMATMLLALSMVIVHLVYVVNHYLGLRTEPPTHTSIQDDYRKKVLDITRRRGPREW